MSSLKGSTTSTSAFSIFDEKFLKSVNKKWSTKNFSGCQAYIHASNIAWITKQKSAKWYKR